MPTTKKKLTSKSLKPRPPRASPAKRKPHLVLSVAVNRKKVEVTPHASKLAWPQQLEVIREVCGSIVEKHCKSRETLIGVGHDLMRMGAKLTSLATEEPVYIVRSRGPIHTLIEAVTDTAHAQGVPLLKLVEELCGLIDTAVTGLATAEGPPDMPTDTTSLLN